MKQSQMNKTQLAIRQEKLDYTKCHIKQLVRDRERSGNIPVPELPDGIYSVDRCNGIVITIGFSPENVRLVWELMRAAGWTNSYGREPDDIIKSFKSKAKSSEYFGWWNDNYEGSFGMWVCVGRDGSNCQRVEIGKETIERPIYELVCNDGVEEGAI